LGELRQRVVVVATKADKLSNKQRAEQKHEITASIAHLPIVAVMFYSSVTALGRRELWQCVNEMVGGMRFFKNTPR
ncbi:MAG: hypothetical protein ACRENG_07230, partial [bacterium]